MSLLARHHVHVRQNVPENASRVHCMHNAIQSLAEPSAVMPSLTAAANPNQPQKQHQAHWPVNTQGDGQQVSCAAGSKRDAGRRRCELAILQHRDSRILNRRQLTRFSFKPGSRIGAVAGWPTFSAAR